jgi:hypothetical protein
MTTLPIGIYKFSAISIKISMQFFTELGKNSEIYKESQKPKPT